MLDFKLRPTRMHAHAHAHAHTHTHTKKLYELRLWQQSFNGTEADLPGVFLQHSEKYLNRLQYTSINLTLYHRLFHIPKTFDSSRGPASSLMDVYGTSESIPPSKKNPNVSDLGMSLRYTKTFMKYGQWGGSHSPPLK